MGETPISEHAPNRKQSRSLASRKSTINIYHHQQSTVHHVVEGLHGRSFFIFGPRNPIRLVCAYITRHRYFKNFISILVVLSTVNLALSNPLDDQNSD